ncbi:putative chromatin regulator PHD family [Rosa chinensis]|uniref:Putative chromatin regulator PHD family n=2 Tax=Rosa chinensis TaxID=74649 RepID=A0A2P6RDF3_ROSCH|nr:putative chromatin regulator PHD family [Rosa chinensis]
MERVEEKLNFHHFSHEHSLEQTNSPLKQNNTCAGCKLMILRNKDYYSCRKCPFFLHQICYNMPRKTRHPAHPNHYLNLHASPSSKGAINCKACGKHVAGFYYHCAECGLYYHSLCSILPFSIATSSHPHALKLSFLPPCDLCCDICSEPAYDGWIYRCHICEFDAHLSCGISDQKLLDSSQSYNIEGKELLQLVRHGFVRSGSHQITEANMPDTIALNPRPQFLYRDSSAPVSEDTTLTPSNQFSDAYFSIDLAKSYSNSPYAQKNEGRKESGHQGPNGTADLVQGTFQSSKVSNKVGPENKLNEAFLTRSDTLTRKELGPEKKRKPIETMGRSNIRNQSTKSDTQESSGSFFQMLCGCCNPGYERNI